MRGVLLATGERDRHDLVVSNADPKRTLLGLVDPVRLDPGFLLRVRNIRARGTLAKVNLALAAPAVVHGRAGSAGRMCLRHEALAGRILIAPGIDYLEQAFDASKYGETARTAVPRVRDPDADGSRARARRAGM